MTKSHVTDHEAQAVVDYAAEVAHALALPGWKILVMDEPSEDDCNASIDTVDGRWVARIWLGEHWMDLDSEQRREIVTHEVLHLLHERVNHVVDDLVHQLRSEDYAAMRRRYTRETELMVDHLARFLASTHTLAEAWEIAHRQSCTAKA